MCAQFKLLHCCLLFGVGYLARSSQTKYQYNGLNLAMKSGTLNVNIVGTVKGAICHCQGYCVQLFSARV